jgi:hypothetical protein
MARELTIRIKADGTQARQDLHATELAIDGVTKEADALDKGVSKATGNAGKAFTALAGALTAASVGELMHRLVTGASDIADQAARIGISAEAFQRLAFASKNGGASMAALSDAILAMSRNLIGSSGKDNVARAVADLGLNLGELRKMKPEEAFYAITDAVRGIDDPMRQSADMLRVFGDRGRELIPAVKDGMREVGAQAPVMSNALVQAGDDIGDKWDKLQTRFDVLEAKALLPFAAFFIDKVPESLQVAGAGIVSFLPSLEHLALGVLAFGGPAGAWAAMVGAGGAVVTFLTVTLPGAFGAVLTFLGPQGLIALAVIALGVVWYRWGDDISAVVQRVYAAVKEWLVDKFTGIVTAVKEKVDAVTGFFGDMYDKVVGHSFVPDMVNEIGQHFGRLDGVMVQPSQSAAMTVNSIFATLQRSVTSKVQGMVSDMTGILGGFVSGVLPGLVSTAFSLIGSLGSAIGGLFESEETKKVNQPRGNFQKQFGGPNGGYDNLGRELTKAFETLGDPNAGNNANGLLFQMNQARTEVMWHNAEDAILDVFHRAGRFDIQRFAQGTLGRYVDFGVASPAILHGKERVMTEAEGRAEAGQLARLEKRFNDLLEEQQEFRRDLTRSLTLAMRRAMVQA